MKTSEYKQIVEAYNGMFNEANWADILLGDVGQKYKISSENLPHFPDTMKHFQVKDKEGNDIQILYGGLIGPFSEISRLATHAPNEDQVPPEILDNDGLLAGFATITPSSMEPEEAILNIFDRKTTLKIITTVVKGIEEIYNNNKNKINWFMLGSANNEESKLKLNKKIIDSFKKKYNAKSQQIKTHEGTFYLLTKD